MLAMRCFRPIPAGSVQDNATGSLRDRLLEQPPVARQQLPRERSEAEREHDAVCALRREETIPGGQPFLTPPRLSYAHRPARRSPLRHRREPAMETCARSAPVEPRPDRHLEFELQHIQHAGADLIELHPALCCLLTHPGSQTQARASIRLHQFRIPAHLPAL